MRRSKRFNSKCATIETYVFPLNCPLYCVLSHRRRRRWQRQSSNNISPVTSTCFPTVERPRFPNWWCRSCPTTKGTSASPISTKFFSNSPTKYVCTLSRDHLLSLSRSTGVQARISTVYTSFPALNFQLNCCTVIGWKKFGWLKFRRTLDRMTVLRKEFLKCSRL